jgi:hypothetical protein
MKAIGRVLFVMVGGIGVGLALVKLMLLGIGSYENAVLKTFVVYGLIVFITIVLAVSIYKEILGVNNTKETKKTRQGKGVIILLMIPFLLFFTIKVTIPMTFDLPLLLKNDVEVVTGIPDKVERSSGRYSGTLTTVYVREHKMYFVLVPRLRKDIMYMYHYLPHSKIGVFYEPLQE